MRFQVRSDEAPAVVAMISNSALPERSLGQKKQPLELETKIRRNDLPPQALSTNWNVHSQTLCQPFKTEVI